MLMEAPKVDDNAVLPDKGKVIYVEYEVYSFKNATKVQYPIITQVLENP